MTNLLIVKLSASLDKIDATICMKTIVATFLKIKLTIG